MDPTAEITALLHYFEQRGLTEPQACAVMGEALNALIATSEAKREFLQTLGRNFFEH